MSKVLLMCYMYLLYIIIKYSDNYVQYSSNITMAVELTIAATFIYLISIWKVVMIDYAMLIMQISRLICVYLMIWLRNTD